MELEHLADWLFSVDHIELDYGLRYEGVDLESLSPGTKGIVLLILHLAIDQEDQRPLIIDQPDENLDNQSIYDILRGYFRQAKERRQVIIVTHNPNLVVNTDADQVIVARCVRADDGPASGGADGADTALPGVRRPGSGRSTCPGAVITGTAGRTAARSHRTSSTPAWMLPRVCIRGAWKAALPGRYPTVCGTRVAWRPRRRAIETHPELPHILRLDVR